MAEYLVELAKHTGILPSDLSRISEIISKAPLKGRIDWDEIPEILTSTAWITGLGLLLSLSPVSLKTQARITITSFLAGLGTGLYEAASD